jgi:hypothetical protein
VDEEFAATFEALKASLARSAKRLAVKTDIAVEYRRYLKKRMQGKSCFNFKSTPEPAIVEELNALTDAAANQWVEKKWM